MPLGLGQQVAQVKTVVGDVGRLHRTCFMDAGLTQVKGFDGPSLLGQSPGVSPSSTSGIQHPCRLTQHTLSAERRHRMGRLGFTAVAVQHVVRLGVEPRPEPFGVCFPHVFLHFL